MRAPAVSARPRRVPDIGIVALSRTVGARQLQQHTEQVPDALI